MKYGHAKLGLKRNDLSISFTTLGSSLSNPVVPAASIRNEEADRNDVNPEVAWARLRFTMSIV